MKPETGPLTARQIGVAKPPPVVPFPMFPMGTAMRLATVLGLAAALYVFTPASTAVAAVPYAISFCFTNVAPSGDVLETFVSSNGVFTFNDTSLGNAQSTNNGRNRETTTNLTKGEVIVERCADIHAETAVVHDNHQVNHVYILFEFTVGGKTCSLLTHVTYANGEVRYKVERQECSQPVGGVRCDQQAAPSVLPDALA